MVCHVSHVVQKRTKKKKLENMRYKLSNMQKTIDQFCITVHALSGE